MLILPEAGHALMGNTLLRHWDYFVEHLLGVEPPNDYQFSTDADDQMKKGIAQKMQNLSN